MGAIVPEKTPSLFERVPGVLPNRQKRKETHLGYHYVYIQNSLVP